MKGTTVRYTPARGKPTFGYSFFAGRDESGKRIQKMKRGFATKAEAEEALRTAIEGHQQTPTPVIEQATPRFAEFFDSWIQNYKSKCSPQTLERYIELGKYAQRHIGELPLDEIGVAEIDDMLLALERSGGRKTDAQPQGKPLATKTVREIGFLVAGCFKKAVARKLVASNPFDGDCQIPELERKEARSLDESEFAYAVAGCVGNAALPLAHAGFGHWLPSRRVAGTHMVGPRCHYRDADREQESGRNPRRVAHQVNEIGKTTKLSCASAGD